MQILFEWIPPQSSQPRNRYFSYFRILIVSRALELEYGVWKLETYQSYEKSYEMDLYELRLWEVPPNEWPKKEFSTIFFFKNDNIQKSGHAALGKKRSFAAASTAEQRF